MQNLPYTRISNFFHVNDELDSEVIDFTIDEDEVVIFRDTTYACANNPEEFPEIAGFKVTISLSEAERLRDFLNFALPK